MIYNLDPPSRDAEDATQSSTPPPPGGLGAAEQDDGLSTTALPLHADYARRTTKGAGVSRPDRGQPRRQGCKRVDVALSPKGASECDHCPYARGEELEQEGSRARAGRRLDFEAEIFLSRTSSGGADAVPRKIAGTPRHPRGAVSPPQPRRRHRRGRRHQGPPPPPTTCGRETISTLYTEMPVTS